MGFRPTPFDAHLARTGVEMILRNILVRQDVRTWGRGFFKLTSEGPKTEEILDFSVPFQFPPTLESDGKTVEYDERSNRFIEPLVIFKGANAREVQIKWQYVVVGGESWNGQNIAAVIKAIRGFFYTSILSQVQHETGAAIVWFRAYNEVGPGSGDTFSFRSEGANINFKGPVIDDNGVQFPMVTEVSMTLKPWVSGQIPGVPSEVNLPGLNVAEKLLDSPEWH